jgi:mannosyltransferase
MSLSTNEQALRRPLREHVSWTVFALVAIGFGLRVYRLGSQSLWIDEFLSLVDATLIHQHETFAASLLHNLHGPFYSLVLFLTWQAAGLSEFWLRFPSALAGTATLIALYALAAELFERHTAWWAVLILALSPFHIWYSQEARNYAFLMFFATLSMYFFHRFCVAGGWRPWVHYVWTSALALLTNLSALFLLLTQGIIVLAIGPSRRRRVPMLVLAGVAVLVLLSPWLMEFNSRMAPARALSTVPVEHEARLRGETTFTPWGIPFTFFVFSLGYSVGPSLRELHAQSPLRAVGGEVWVVVLTALVFGLVSALGIWKTREDRAALATILLYLGVPILILSFLAARNIKVFNPRYLMVCLPAYVLLLARGLSQVGRAWLRWMNLGLVLLLFLYSLANHYFDPRYMKEDFRGAARYVSSQVEPRDVILTTNCRSAFDLYYGGRAVVHDWCRLFGDDPAVIARRLDDLTRGHDRLWLVQVREWERDPHGSTKGVFQSHFGLLEEKSFPGIRVSLFDLRACGGENR